MNRIATYANLAIGCRADIKARIECDRRAIGFEMRAIAATALQKQVDAIGRGDRKPAKTGGRDALGAFFLFPMWPHRKRRGRLALWENPNEDTLLDRQLRELHARHFMGRR